MRIKSYRSRVFKLQKRIPFLHKKMKFFPQLDCPVQNALVIKNLSPYFFIRAICYKRTDGFNISELLRLINELVEIERLFEIEAEINSNNTTSIGLLYGIEKDKLERKIKKQKENQEDWICEIDLDKFRYLDIF